MLARSERRILLTEDKDFGELALRAGVDSPGVILFRDLGASVDESWTAFRSLLARHASGLERSLDRDPRWAHSPASIARLNIDCMLNDALRQW